MCACLPPVCQASSGPTLAPVVLASARVGAPRSRDHALDRSHRPELRRRRLEMLQHNGVTATTKQTIWAMDLVEALGEFRNHGRLCRADSKVSCMEPTPIPECLQPTSEAWSFASQVGVWWTRAHLASWYYGPWV